MSLASVFSYGVAPVVVGGVAGSAAIRWQRFSLSIEGSALFAPSATIEHLLISNGYRYVVVTAALLGCYHPSWFICAHVDTSVLSVDHSDARIIDAQTASVSFGPRLGGEWALTPWLTVRAYGEILVRPIAGRLRDFNTEALIWRGVRWSGSLGVGPVFTFPEN